MSPVPEHGSHINGVARQSSLRQFDQCPLRAVKEATATFNDFSSGPASLGTAFHLVAEELLRTLWRQGEDRVPTEEAQAIAREVIARPECPHLSVEQQRELRILVLQFASQSWPAARVIGIEERLTASVRCPDGRERQITGQPDVLLADPPGGAVVVDFKTGWSVPPSSRDGDYSRDSGRPYLSERGTFQLDTLAYLVMSTYPSIDQVILREYYPRLNEVREAVLIRSELEHVEHRLGVLAERFEKSLAGDIVPEPRPGKWCSHCHFARCCPVPAESRGLGVIGSPGEADAEAARFQVVKALADQQRAALKAWYEVTGHAPRVGDGTALFWRSKPNGGREFGVFPWEPERVAPAKVAKAA